MIPYYWQYLPLAMQIVVAFGLAGMMVFASQFIGRHRNSKTKLEAYECGIEAVGDARRRFSVRFYMVTMLFLLFDVETVFMMPWAVIYTKLPAITGSKLFGFWEMIVYLGFVAVGLYYIVRKGILNWSTDKADL
jgi:NADH-quinone oxidoreductase subunit A